jgi:hypothetical protein
LDGGPSNTSADRGRTELDSEAFDPALPPFFSRFDAFVFFEFESAEFAVPFAVPAFFCFFVEPGLTGAGGGG